MQQNRSLNVFSLNTIGLGERLKRTTLYKWLSSNFTGITFLQEVHSTLDSEQSWSADFTGYNVFYSHGTSNARGVCTLIPTNYNIKIINHITDKNGRYSILHTFIEDADVVLANIYAPTKNNQGDQILFLAELREQLLSFLGKKIILGGDFNTYMDPLIDKQGGFQETQSNYARKLIDLLEEFDLCDIFRLQHPNTPRYTWRNKVKGGLVQSRLDMFFVSSNMQFQQIKSYIRPSVKSDHS